MWRAKYLTWGIRAHNPRQNLRDRAEGWRFSPCKMRVFRFFWLLAVTVTLTSAAAEPLTRAALIIDESDPSGGIPTTLSATLRATLRNSTPRVAVFGETLDLTRFSDPRQELVLRTYV